MAIGQLAYGSDYDEDAAQRREAIVLQHLPQVRVIAKQIHNRVPDSVCLDDLVSTGVVGLLAAVDNFNPSYNVQLNTYAERRIVALSWTACAIWTGLRVKPASVPR